MQIVLCLHLARLRAGLGATVHRVGTAGQLKDALESGAARVHVTQHLDLRGLPAAPKPSDCRGTNCTLPLFWGPPALQSLTVRARCMRGCQSL